MARAAVLRRLTWLPVTIAEIRAETESASTLVLGTPDWPGHLAGQHVDVRLTAEDGYAAERSYSIASSGMPVMAPLEITVQRVEDGEVSPYLVDIARTGDQFEVRGPIGGFFTYEPADPDPDADADAEGHDDAAAPPVLAIAGGSGIVPLMSMARTHAGARSEQPFRLVYSVRTPDDAIYEAELASLPGVDLEYAYTRGVPNGWPRPAGRLDAARLAQIAFPAAQRPQIFVCGPTGFVETVADLLVDAGHEPHRIKTERFGPTGG